MKFFTPELLRRTRSPDQAVWSAASEEWEVMLKDYSRHLKAIRPRMSDTTRAVLRLPTLHDGLLVGSLGQMKGPQIELLVRLEDRKGEPTRFLLFRYQTATRHSKDSFSEEVHDIGAKGDVTKYKPHILYDEFDVDKRGAFTHAILLSNGTEVRVRFRDLVVVAAEPLSADRAEQAAPELVSA
jgi:hypothetical protein